LKKSLSATIRDLNADEVSIEVNFLRGLPRINLVGLASSEVKESVERIRSAISESGFRLPPKVITINLSPSEIKKSGSHFDLGISLMIAMFDDDDIDFSDWHIFGELGLDGSVKDSNAIFPAILSLKREEKIKKVLIPKASVSKVSQIPDIEIYGVNTIAEAIDHFKGIITLKPTIGNELSSENIKIFEKSFHFIREFPLDFDQVFGQNVAKRASTIAVSGLHNMILEGSPGSGKSMIAKRLQYVLPPLKKDEILDIAKFEALNGENPNFLPKRPFRSPHHTASKGSIFGGGTRTAKIGEVSMANSGILFFDELPHFTKQILEAMREPLQDYSILISRVNSKIEYPADFLFVGAMNPCPCGYLMSKTKSCRCTDYEIRKYQNILSEPFWDRIDLYVAMDEVSPEDKGGITSNEIFGKMLEAFYKQIERGQTKLNGRLDERDLEQFSRISERSLEVLKRGSERFGLSLRGMNKVKKVARTIADLDSAKDIEKSHILEAFSYRRRNSS
jgi:magnesium chelatase family protein